MGGGMFGLFPEELLLLFLVMILVYLLLILASEQPPDLLKGLLAGTHDGDDNGSGGVIESRNGDKGNEGRASGQQRRGQRQGKQHPKDKRE